MSDEQTPAPAVAPAPAKKNNAAVIIIIVVGVLVVLSVGGYFISRYIARKAGEKISEGILGAATGGKVDVNSSTGGVSVNTGDGSTSIGGNVKWPSDMPSDVPELKTGTLTISSTDKTNKSWMVTASDITQSEFNDYKSLVEAAGWTSSSSTSMGYDLLSYEKADHSITLLYDSSESGISITVTTTSQ